MIKCCLSLAALQRMRPYWDWLRLKYILIYINDNNKMKTTVGTCEYRKFNVFCVNGRVYCPLCRGSTFPAFCLCSSRWLRSTFTIYSTTSTVKRSWRWETPSHWDENDFISPYWLDTLTAYISLVGVPLEDLLRVP